MSEQEKSTLLSNINSTPLRSKKFIAAMLWNLFWLVLIGYGIHVQIEASVLSAMVYVSGIVQALYLGGQSAVDAIVRAAMARSTIQQTGNIADK